jgi:8-oxo-dGTP pyrophosphatase MutT (NUDIX family)
VIKEATASALLIRHVDDAWQVGLAYHRRLGGWLPAGGHVEVDETPAEAALREIIEETGYTARLLPGPALPLPDGFPHRPVVAAFWIVEMPASPDNHTAEPHVHLDHLFVAVVDDDRPPADAETAVRWFTQGEISEAPGISEDTRLQAKEVFRQLGVSALAM